MDHYKADTTLNEKDSLQDMLNLEKSLVKIYSTAMTEGCSNGFRAVIKDHWQDSVSDQMDVFLQMTELGYYQVESAPEETLKEQRAKFCQIKSQLS
ncbi:MAG: spore coat protein [Clostridia bacterium]|nr:spore coat protein [Clostridia bacterium]